MKELENTLQDLKCMLIEDGYKDDNIVMRTLIKAQQQVKNLNIPAVSNLLCGFFEPDNKTSSATKCKCGREKWEHPKAT
jgi:hypothetical protein